MRGISLSEPWATLVAIGAKKLETRSWSTSYVGPVAIHAAKRFPNEYRSLLAEEPFRSALERVNPTGKRWLGCVLAVGELTACNEITLDNAPDVETAEYEFGDYTPGRFMFSLARVRRLARPIPLRGALGLWSVPPDIASLILASEFK